MARLTVVVAVVVVAAVCSAEAGTDYASQLKAVQAAASAVQANLSKQWEDVLNSQRQKVVALINSIIKKQKSAEAKAALTDVAAKLAQNLTAVNSHADTLKKQQGQQFNQLSTAYVSLINQRIKATGAAATAEVPIFNLRKRKSTFLAVWENRVMDINSQYRAAYNGVFSAASQAAASKPAVRAALRAMFLSLLQRAVVGQEENITLLTAKQFPQVEKFALLAGHTLLQLLVRAQGAAL